MELNNRIIHIKISVKEAVAILAFHPDDAILVFADLDTPIGLILNCSDVMECFVIFSSHKVISEGLNWLGP